MAEVDGKNFVCEPCASEDKRIPAEGYCEVCKEYLCETCLAVHRKQSMSRSHTIIDKTQMLREKEVDTSVDVCVDICTTHPTEIVKYYCKAHGETGCGDCMVLKHTTCDKQRLQDVSKGFRDTNDFLLVQQGLHKLCKEIAATQTEIDGDMKAMTTTYSSILQGITTYRKTVNDYLDTMQKQITEQADKMKKTEENSIKQLDAKNKSLKSDVDTLLHRLQSCTKNVNSLFIATNEINQKLPTIQKDALVIQQDKQKQQYKLHCHEFMPSAEIQRIISEKMPFGKLLHKPKYTYQSEQGRQSGQTSSTMYLGEISVKELNQKHQMCITSSTPVTEDRLVLTEMNNRLVQLIDLHNSQVLDRLYYTVHKTPGAVTAISPTQVAVTMPLNNTIELIHVHNRLMKTKEIQVNGSPLGISYKNMKLVVLSGNKIEIMSLIGEVLHTIDTTSVPLETFEGSCGQFVAFGPDNNSVVLPCHFKNKVHLISINGTTVKTYRHNSLHGPSNVVTTEEGSVLVGSSENSCIHIVSPTFQSSRIILQNDDYLDYIWSFSYCQRTKKLYVCGGSTIKVFDLKNEIIGLR